MVVESYVCSEWVSGGPLIGSSIIIVLTADLHFRRTLDFPNCRRLACKRFGHQRG